MKLHQLTVGSSSARIRKAVKVTSSLDEPEEAGVEATESAPGELRRRTQQAEPRQWSRMFGGASVMGARLRSARKFTK